MKNIFFFFVGIILLNSCKTTTGVYKAYYKDANAQNVSNSTIIQSPVLVDLEVDENKVKGTFEKDSVSVTYAKNMALNNALDKAKADVLVEPIYETEIVNQNVKVNVTGFPAKYKNFRKPEAGDTTLLNWVGKGSYNTSIMLRQESYNKEINENLIPREKCNAMVRQGKIMSILGGTFMGIGVGGVLTTILVQQNNRYSNPEVWATPLYIVGGFFATVGTVVLPIGAVRKKAGKKCLTDYGY
ncbi:MAG: hypothetical protein R2836_07745 [Chitinophagales bacterium]